MPSTGKPDNHHFRDYPHNRTCCAQCQNRREWPICDLGCRAIPLHNHNSFTDIRAGLLPNRTITDATPAKRRSRPATLASLPHQKNSELLHCTADFGLTHSSSPTRTCALTLDAILSRGTEPLSGLALLSHVWNRRPLLLFNRPESNWGEGLWLL